MTSCPGINMKASCEFIPGDLLTRLLERLVKEEGIWNATFNHNYNQCLLTRDARIIPNKNRTIVKWKTAFSKSTRFATHTKSAKKVHMSPR